ncbi:DUF397 domain-containing protein [Streptomyces sp. NBC_00663]|nr:DUF397 domain-containing protein [Streptomyces sp. NBC_00663]
MAVTPATIHVRDSKTPETHPVQITPATWTRFVNSLA